MKINRFPAWISHLVLLVWIFIVYGCGLWNYSTGFLLSRIVIDDTNYHDNSVRLKENAKGTGVSHAFQDIPLCSEKVADNSCFPTRFKRAIWIIIDGLRYDFALYNGSGEISPYFHHKMPVFKDTLRRRPQSAFLAPFIADPPTTTLQRLTGLTTGSLPTFIDLSANFAGSEITEDNVISQAVHTGQSIVFMGDDTWKDLFPGKFRRSYFYPSFNVKDLHTVDRGILNHLIPELQKGDFDLLVAHFLGVDHCGHRYGPSHPEMASKLQEMDRVIRDVMSNMTADTILFVMGDHGMTRTGDHGGDSLLEVNSALFIYSPTKLRPIPSQRLQSQPIPQVDFVPTLSLLLGLPIPFSNLGCLIPDLFQVSNEVPPEGTSSSRELKYHSLYNLLEALHRNALQVSQYLRAYATLSQEFGSAELSRLETTIHEAFSLRDVCHSPAGNVSVLNRTCDVYLKYLRDVKYMCSKKWAQFDVFTMWIGIGTLISVTVVVGILTWALTEGHADMGIMGLIIILGTSVWVILALVLYLTKLCSSWRNLMTLMCLITLKPMLVQNFKYIRKCQCYASGCLLENATTYLATFVCILAFFASFSNSFVINEDALTLFLTMSLLVAGLVQKLRKIASSAFKNKTTVTRAMLTVAAILLSVRLGSWFYKCREEQEPCETSPFLQSLSSLPAELQSYKNGRLLLSVICAVSWMIGFIWVLNHYRKLYGDDLTVLFVRYALPLATMCLCGHWVLGLAPTSTLERLLPQKQEVPAQSACVLCLLVALVTFILPPGILQGPRWDRFHQCLLSSGVVLQLSLLLLLQLLAGDGLAPTWLLLCAAPAIWWAIQAAFTNNEKSLEGFPSWHFIVTWWSLCVHGFYATGHQATFSSLHWNAAFVTTSGNHTSRALPAATVLLNTFSSQALFTLPMPLLVSGVEIFRRKLIGPSLTARILADPTKMQRSLPIIGTISFSRYEIMLLRFQLGYIFCCGLKLLGSVFASCFLRRHLMVWKVFAPKLIFESLALAVTSIFLFLGHLLFLRVALRLNST